MSGELSVVFGACGWSCAVSGMPASRLETDGRGQPCPQCELESWCRAIRVMPSLCEVSEQMVRCEQSECAVLGVCVESR